MKKQWILGTLGIAALAVILIIIGVRGAWADVPTALAAKPVHARQTGSLNLSGQGAISPTVWQVRTAVAGGSGAFSDSGQSLGSASSMGVALGDVDGNGTLYLADEAPWFVTAWGSQGSGPDQFGSPRGVAVDSAGNVYVADTGNHRVQKFTSEGSFLTAWGSFGYSQGQFNAPHGVAVDSAGNVYVADTENNRIQKFTSEGSFVTAWGSFGRYAPGQFCGPRDVEVDGAGNVYVADYCNNRIQKFTSEGSFLAAWASGAGPYGVAVDAASNVYVTGEAEHRIEKFTSEGSFLTAWGNLGSGQGQFAYPYGVAVDVAGNVYIADTGNNRIQKFTSEGAFLIAWGGYGSGQGQFDWPNRVAVDAASNVYVADTGNYRIQKFALITTTLIVTSTADSGPGTLRQALLDANSGDTITFDPTVFPPGSPVTIVLTSGQLPDLDDGNVTIDASNVGVILDGSAFSGGEDGFGITSSGNVIKGLQIVNFPGDGIEVCCGAQNNVIGGSTAAGRNVISGNGQNGIRINGAGVMSNTIIGNLIGTDASGMLTLGNSEDGVLISDGAHDNTIGGTMTGERNVISGNRGGVAIVGSHNNRVVGNYIGPDVTGMSIVPGGDWSGVYIAEGSTGNTVGGMAACERNVIAGQGSDGVTIRDSGTMNNTIIGNYIGTDASGMGSLTNDQDGVDVAYGPQNNAIEHNVIAHNGDSGVRIWGTDTMSNTISGNHIGLDLDGARQAFPTDAAISPDYPSDCTLYVASRSTGAHKSTDCGDTWVEVNNGLTESRLMQVEIPPDAADANTVYALAENGYLFATTDGGANWSLLSTTLEGIDRRNLVLSAEFTSDQTMYASAEHWSWDELGNGPGVFKSEDGGVTWERMVNGMSDDHVWKVIASPDPAEKETLFALTHSGIEKSTDGGANWSAIASPDTDLSDLAISPAYASDQTIFVTADTGRAYSSTDGGGSWSGVDALRDDPRHLALSPDYPNDQTVCHGGGWNDWIYCSTDGGATWTQTDTGLPGWLDDAGTGIVFSPAYPSDLTMFVVSVAGMAKSTDGGATWELVTGLRDLDNKRGVSIGDGASYNTIGPDNVISNNHFGVIIEDEDTAYNVVAGNYIGMDTSGTVALGNGAGAGVHIKDGAKSNVVGGDTPEERNIICGNETGVWITGSGTTGNTVSGNYIGTDVSGTVSLGNNGPGVDIRGGARNNTIGGATAGEHNVISGENVAGVVIEDPGTESNTVIGNYIGTDATGTAALGNIGEGVFIYGGAKSNIVETNLISGNDGDGVRIEGSDTMSNTISGNYIGTDVSGMTVLGNGNAGVYVRDGTQYNIIGGNNATPGGNCTGECNLISGNGWDGVAIRNSGTMSNTISGNYIGTDVSGTVGLGNSEWDDGVGIRSGPAYNVIGGVTPGERNLLSGNGDNGVKIDSAMNNIVIGNYIGTDTSGTVAIGNVEDGVGIQGEASFNRIGGNTVNEHNLISGNGEAGVSIRDGGTNNTVSGNLIGTDASGTAALPNGGNGVSISDSASYNLIGGASEGERNLISGNGGDGVRIEGSNTISNTVSGNYIGTDASGTLALGNGSDGVRMESGTRYNVIGGDSPGERNVVSGNDFSGISMGGGATENVVIGNYIGTDTSGMVAVGNGQSQCQAGVALYGDAHHNRIGGSSPEERNLTSGNNCVGVAINLGIGTDANLVLGNYIGTDVTGSGPLGNTWTGVYFADGASENLIGGSTVGDGNLIAYNDVYGVYVRGTDTLNNTLSRNSIHSNADKGIELTDGGNLELPAPVITSMDLGAGTVAGTACPSCTIEVFSDDDDEGRWYEGTTTADGAGNWSLSKGSAFTGPNVHATATDAGGNTSEFGRKPMTLYVDVSNDTDWEDGSAMHPFNTLEEAMEVDADGDTVLVAQGTYVENITIDREITLEGGYASYTSPDSWTRDIALYETIIDGSNNQTVVGDWDGSWIGSPVVISTGITLEMWYDGRDLTGSAQLGRAASSDGVNWTKDAGNPLFGSGAPGDWDEGSVWEPFVLLDGGTYEMWYTADGDAIGYATSTDGITWTRHLDPVLEGGPEGAWDEDGVSDPHVIKADGTYTMWYESWTDTRRIGCATSTDGINWTKCAANPVFEPGNPGDWDETAVHDPVVVLRDGTYHMWYRGTGPDGIWHIGYVTSTDGIAWTRFLADPVLSGTAGEWDEGSVGLGDVFFDGATYHMWYGANGQIGYATSPDGISWTKSISNPVLTLGTSGHWGQPVVRFEAGSDGSVLDGFTITGGDAQDAGGVHANEASITIRKCLIHDNSANGSPNSAAGAGVLGGWPGTTLTIVDSRIVSNQVNQGAGGVRVYDGTLVMTNTLIADNHGEDGLHLNGPATLMNVTVSDNDGGILFNPQFSATLRITNSIIYNNGHSLWSSGAGTVQVAYSDVEGGWPGTGNIDADPRFVDPASDDYHLQAGSPCIDAGTADGTPDHDFEGDPRPWGLGVDMGADEALSAPVPVPWLRIPLDTEPPTLDINLATDTTSHMVLNQLMEALYRYKPDGSTEPAGATGYEVSADGKVYTITLRTDALWSDGVPVIAQHYVDGIIRLLDPDTGTENAWLMYFIEGAEEFNTGQTTDPSTVGVRVVNIYALEITLTEPLAFFLSILALPTTYPVRLDIIHSDPDWTEAGHFVGNGPYDLTKWNHGNELIVEKNPLYHDADQVSIEKVVFPIIADTAVSLAAYENSLLDVSGYPSEELPRILVDPVLSKELHRLPRPGIYYLGVNTLRSPTDNPLARKALASAIDRQYIISDVLYSPWREYATGVIPPEIPGYQGKDVGYDFDVTAAQQFFADAGYPGGVGFPGVELWYNEGNADVCESVASMWEDNLGITVTTVTEPWSEYLDRLDHCDNPAECTYGAYRMGWVMDYGDANDILNVVFHPDSPFQYTGWDNARYRELMDFGLAETDQDLRIEYYQEAERILVEDEVAVIPLYFYDRNTLIKSNVVFEYPPFGAPHFMKWNKVLVPTISDVRTTNVRDTSFTVSWITDIPSDGHVNYGTAPAALDQIAYDNRGAETNDDTHYVTLEGLSPNTTYYFDVVSGSTTDDNDGAHYTVTTGPTLGLPGSDTIWGQVFEEDETTLAEGAIVYITLQDADGSGSPDEAATLSALVDDTGYWTTNLGNARTSDLSAYFTYSASGDQVRLEAQGAADGTGCLLVDTADDSPAEDLILNVSTCISEVEIPLQIGWNHISLPLDPLTPYTAEGVCSEINSQGGGAVEIDRWYASGWDGHICGLPFNDFAIELGSDYFIKSSAVSTWTIEGYPVTTDVPLELQIGWNSIGIPHTDAYTAQSLCEDINDQCGDGTTVEVDRWYASGWDGHICGLPFNDFAIEIGKGYFVKAGAACTITPSLAVLSGRWRMENGEWKMDDSPPSVLPLPSSLLHREGAITEVKVTNVRDASFTVSWSTDVTATGWVNYGTSLALGQTAYDDHGARAIGQSHHVTLQGLSPQTTYYFEVVSGATVDGNSSCYQVTTGPTLGLPTSDSIYGQVFESDGVTPAEGAIVYITLRDADGVGSQGEARVMSALVDADGWWQANLSNARLADGKGYFTYSAAGDAVVLVAQGAGGGLVSWTVDTGDLGPAPPLTLVRQRRPYLPPQVKE